MPKKILTNVFHCCVLTAIFMLIPRFEHLKLDNCIRIGLLAINGMFLVQRIHTVAGQREKATFGKIVFGALFGIVTWMLWSSVPFLIITIPSAMLLTAIFSIVLTGSIVYRNQPIYVRIEHLSKRFLQELDIVK